MRTRIRFCFTEIDRTNVDNFFCTGYFSNGTRQCCTPPSTGGRRRRSTVNAAVSQISVSVGSSLNASCVIVGTPKPSAQWLFCPDDNVTVTECNELSNQSIGNAQYFEDSVDVAQDGVFACVAVHSDVVEFLWNISVRVWNSRGKIAVATCAVHRETPSKA